MLVGRSIAQFYLAGLTGEGILCSARNFAADRDLRIDEDAPHHLTVSRGSKFWTVRRALRVSAKDAPGGATVTIEAWAESWPWGELSASPRAFFGFLARKIAWSLTADFLNRIGITQPESLFRHE